VKDGLHSIVLEMPAKIYETFYGDLSEENAREILVQYLKYRQDDARISDVKIDYDDHTVNIYANLHYLGNDKTEQEVFAKTK